MKKTLRFLLIFSAVTVIGMLLAVSAFAQVYTGKCGQNVRYTLDTSTGRLTIYGNGEMSDFPGTNGVSTAPWADKSLIEYITTVTILQGVTSIGSHSFSFCSNLTKVTIPESVTSIGAVAFSNCIRLNNLYINDLGSWLAKPPMSPILSSSGGNLYIDGKLATDITIPEGTKVIPPYAFYNCTSLTKITIPNSVENIGYSAFTGCKNLTEVNIPESVTVIKDYAFQKCESFTSVTIPGNVKNIGNSAFSGCTNLANLIISDGVESVGTGAFSGCNSLLSVNIPGSVKKVLNSCFASCTSLTDVTFSEGVTYTGVGMFSGCGSLKNVDLPDSLLYILSSTFNRCSSLASITIPSNLEHIGDDAFVKCSALDEIHVKDVETWMNVKLASSGSHPLNSSGGDLYVDGIRITSVKIPDSITSIGAYTFYKCVNLNDVTLNDSVSSIGDYAFYNCKNLTDIKLSDSVESIGDYAFCGCAGLKSVVIKENVTSISELSFLGCGKLTEIEVVENNKAYCDVDGILFTKDMKKLVVYPGGKEEKGYIIGDNVSSLGAYAFLNCVNLKKIVIPRSVMEFGEYSFGVKVFDEIWVFKNSAAEEYFRSLSKSHYFLPYLRYIDDLIFEENNVNVQADDDKTFDEGTQMVLTELPKGELGNFAITKENGEKPNMVAYDITFELDGEEVQPNGYVTVRIKVPQNFNGKKCKIYHYDEYGNATDMNAEYIDGYMVFRTNHFSIYVMADMSISVAGDVDESGSIDVKDAVLLAQFLAKWSVEVDAFAADCNGDEIIDTKDAVLLAQYLAKWSVNLG